MEQVKSALGPGGEAGICQDKERRTFQAKGTVWKRYRGMEVYGVLQEVQVFYDWRIGKVQGEMGLLYYTQEFRLCPEGNRESNKSDH